MKACGRSGGTAALTLNSGTRWGVTFTLWPLLTPGGGEGAHSTDFSSRVFLYDFAPKLR